MRPSSVVYSSVVALAGFLFSTSGQAQTTAPEASTSPTMATARITSASSARGRGLGVGAVTMLNGTNGAMVTWGSDGGGFHVDALAGLHRYTPTNFAATTSFTGAARGWYHLHAASFADFSLGGGLGVVRWVSDPGRTNSDTHWDVVFEVGAQIRAFIVPNVALLADVGLGMTFGTHDDFLVGGQGVGGTAAPEGAPNGDTNFVGGTLGIAYFFE